MKILIIGGDGNIGYPISKKLHINNEIKILCKDKPKFDDGINYIVGDGYNKVFLEEIQEKNNFDIGSAGDASDPLSVHATRESSGNEWTGYDSSSNLDSRVSMVAR